MLLLCEACEGREVGFLCDWVLEIMSTFLETNFRSRDSIIARVLRPNLPGLKDTPRSKHDSILKYSNNAFLIKILLGSLDPRVRFADASKEEKDRRFMVADENDGCFLPSSEPSLIPPFASPNK